MARLAQQGPGALGLLLSQIPVTFEAKGEAKGEKSETRTLTPAEIQKILSVRYPTAGEVGPPVFTENTQALLYEFLYTCSKHGVDISVAALSASLAAGVRGSGIVFASPVFADEKRRDLEEIDRARMAADIFEGVDRCPECKDYRTITTRMQTRSADEATATIIYCLNKSKIVYKG